MSLMEKLPATSLRVENASDPRVNDRIRFRSDAEVITFEHAGDEAIASRLAQLDREWDIERTLQLNASVVALTGALLGLSKDRRFFLLPTAVFSFLLQHALQGWCPPIPVFRRFGVRTVREIARERYALKALRGDFDGLPDGTSTASERVEAVLSAVDR